VNVVSVRDADLVRLVHLSHQIEKRGVRQPVEEEVREAVGKLERRHAEDGTVVKCHRIHCCLGSSSSPLTEGASLFYLVSPLP